MNKIVYFKNLLLAFIFSCSSAPVCAADAAWRLQGALNLPTWLSLSGSHRTRFENLDNQYRAGRNGGDQVLLFRTLLLARAKLEHFSFAAEFEDARAELADPGTPLSTSDVNTLELLQAYVEIPINDLFITGSKSSLRGGRITMDVGSRRFVARNRFRNTLNAFSGVDWQWSGTDNSQVRLFYTLPVQRRVSGGILDNDARFDKERDDVRFWGLYYAPATLPWGDKGEVFLFGLNEDDTAELASADRDIYTAGFRLYRPPAKHKFDYQLESAFQFGESRASATAATDLDHFAHFQHIDVGYTFDATWSPWLQFQYDYASGDDDPADADNNRFDTLFGARRFDFGPTSIYGPFARANIRSPGARLTLKPRAGVDVFTAVRGFWLASDDDLWTTARIGNAPGQADNYIGTQVEVRVRWDVVPGNVGVEAGAAHIFAGELMDRALKDDATYVYSQITLSF